MPAHHMQYTSTIVMFLLADNDDCVYEMFH
jgi:hypothetical protein